MSNNQIISDLNNILGRIELAQEEHQLLHAYMEVDRIANMIKDRIRVRANASHVGGATTISSPYNRPNISNIPTPSVPFSNNPVTTFVPTPSIPPINRPTTTFVPTPSMPFPNTPGPMLINPPSVNPGYMFVNPPSLLQPQLSPRSYSTMPPVPKSSRQPREYPAITAA